MPKNSIIFDFDGTLIDSAPSILNSLQYALNEALVTPLYPLDESLIGPPLTEVVSNVLGKEQQDRIPRVVECFKRYYDTQGYKSSLPYAGMEHLLEQLKQANFDIYIATNKRFLPTKNIVNYLGWTDHFKKVYALDYFRPAAIDKSAMLSCVKLEVNQDSKNLLYVGDRKEDADAAKANEMPFLWVSWGYGKFVESIGRHSIVNVPMQILEFASISQSN